jgi:hypothetical protein
MARLSYCSFLQCLLVLISRTYRGPVSPRSCLKFYQPKVGWFRRQLRDGAEFALVTNVTQRAKL